MATKRYSKRVFAGKDVPFQGINQGAGVLYRGRSVQFSMNGIYDGAILLRSGGKATSRYDGSIRNGLSNTNRTVCEGTNIWSEKV